MPDTRITVDRDAVVRLWLHRQGLVAPCQTAITARAFTDHLNRTGALQLDTINVVDRAHYLTLWSRFGPYDRTQLDHWIYDDRVAYEYWGHEASILPISHLPLGRRRMQRFPPQSWRAASWWKVYQASPASRRRVLRRLRREGPLESADFERRPADHASPGQTMPLAKEDKRALQLLWHEGKVAVRSRRHFRRIYDLAERVYPQVPPATTTSYEDSWLLIGLSGNGIARERDLVNYWTAPKLRAGDRKRVIARNLRKGRIVEVRVAGLKGCFYGLPEHLARLSETSEPQGTTLICPFDSLLWQRSRAEELLDFRYRIEIYVPPAKRLFGYYVLPILHNGRLVGRLDPKFNRDQDVLEVKSIYREPGFDGGRAFIQGLSSALASLAAFLGATDLRLPQGWRALA